MKISAKECRDNNQRYLDSRKEEFEKNKNLILENIYNDLRDSSEDSSDNSYTLDLIVNGSIYSYYKYGGFGITGSMYEYFEIDIKGLEEIFDVLLELGFSIGKDWRKDEDEDIEYFEITIKW